MTHLTVTRHEPPKSALPPVWVTFLAHRNIWLLVEEYRVKVLHEEDEFEFRIPQNFEFDLASVPRVFWSVIGSFELSLVAPLIHDYLYRFRGRPEHHTRTQEPHLVVLTRRDADQIFLALMLREGVPSWKAKLAYRAVRWFAPRW